MKSLSVWALLCGALVCAACDEVEEADEDAGTDTDADSDADGDACSLEFSVGSDDPVVVDGVCQGADAFCEGGTGDMIIGVEVDPAGTCTGGDVCCVSTDTCEALAVVMGGLACAQEATGDYCLQIGCPDQGYCCAAGT